MSCSGGCILWGVSAVDFSVAMVLVTLLALAPCVNLALFAVLSLLFRWFKKPAWIPVLHRLVGSTLWFMRFGFVFGIFNLLAPADLARSTLNFVYYLVAIPFCVALLYWGNRLMRQVNKIILMENMARFQTKLATLAKITQYTNFDFAATSTARENSVGHMLNLLRYCIWFLLLWIVFNILGIDIGVALRETSFFCFALVLPVTRLIRSFSLGTLWLFIFEKDEWAVGFSPGNVVDCDGQISENVECALRSQVVRVKQEEHASTTGGGGAVVHIPHGYFTDRLGASVNGRRKIQTPFHFKLALDKSATSTTKDIAVAIDKIHAYLSTIHGDLSTNYGSEFHHRVHRRRGKHAAAEEEEDGRVVFDCENWALDVYVSEVHSTFESEESLYGEIVLGLIETLSSNGGGSGGCLLGGAAPPRPRASEYVFYLMELPLRYD